MTLAGYSFKTIQSQYLGGAEGARLGELIENLQKANKYQTNLLNITVK